MEEMIGAQDKPRVATIRRRPKDEQSFSDSTCTPKWLADYLYETRGAFAIDPFSNPRSHIIADWSYSLEKGLDGLKLPHVGDSFVNWPYSGPLPFALKVRHELVIGRCTEAVILCKADSSPQWWGALVDHQALPAPDQWQFKSRIQFDEHPEAIAQRLRKIEDMKARGEKSPPEKTSNNFSSVILHFRGFKKLAPQLKLERFATLWRRPW